MRSTCPEPVIENCIQQYTNEKKTLQMDALKLVFALPLSMVTSVDEAAGIVWPSSWLAAGEASLVFHLFEGVCVANYRNPGPRRGEPRVGSGPAGCVSGGSGGK